MAGLTLLQIINQSLGELGLAQQTQIFGNSDATTIQMLALAQRVVDEIRRMNRWTAMQVEFNVTVNPAVTSTGNLTNDLQQITNISPTTTVLGLAAGSWMASGPGIAQAARIQSVDSPTQVTLTMPVVGSTTGATVLFAQDTFVLPNDMDWTNNRTMWDRTNRWELLGPDSPQMDQWHRSGIVVTGPRRHFRFLNTGPNFGAAGANTPVWRIWPPPFDLQVQMYLVYEYLSTHGIMLNGLPGTTAQYWTNDNDQSFLDDNAIINGLKWMFWEAKGFNFLTMQNRWVDYMDQLVARDGSAGTLNLVKRVHPIFISPANVQDGFFPGPVGPNSG